MPTIGTITQTNNPSGKYVKNVQSATLDAAAEATDVMNAGGFKTHDIIVTPTSTTDTNNIDVIVWGTVNDGASFFKAATANYGTAQAGVPQKITYTGYLDQYYVELDSIAAGSPTLNDIHAVSYDQY